MEKWNCSSKWNFIIIMTHTEELLLIDFFHSFHPWRILFVNSRIHSRQKMDPFYFSMSRRVAKWPTVLTFFHWLHARCLMVTMWIWHHHQPFSRWSYLPLTFFSTFFGFSKKWLMNNAEVGVQPRFFTGFSTILWPVEVSYWLLLCILAKNMRWWEAFFTRSECTEGGQKNL